MRLYFLLFAFILSSCGTVGGGSGDNITPDEMEMRYNYDLLRAYFYHPERIKDYSEYEGMKVDAMYESLEDYLRGGRYTRYYTPDIAYEMLHHYTHSETYYSFGFERELYSGVLLVTAVYPNSPANTAGLKKWDILVSANDISLISGNAALYEESDDLFPNSTVFTVVRDGGDPFALPAMQKEEVLSSTVFLDSLSLDAESDEPGIPFIRVTEFTATTNNPNGTYQEFRDVLQEIRGARTAIIDLRNNPGGSIAHCTAMAAELSPPDAELLYDVEHHIRNRRNVIDTTHYFARDFLRGRTGDGIEIQWIVLVSEGSASCAERFAVALKSARPETVIIGETTYGKGIGQNLLMTYLEGLALITCLQSYYPNGQTFHEVGVVPNVPVNPYGREIYNVAYQTAQDFGYAFALKKQSPRTVSIENLPPMHSSKKTDIGAYKPITSSMETFEHLLSLPD